MIESQGPNPNKEATCNEAPAHNQVQSRAAHAGKKLSPEECSNGGAERGGNDCVAYGDIGDNRCNASRGAIDN